MILIYVLLKLVSVLHGYSVQFKKFIQKWIDIMN